MSNDILTVKDMSFKYQESMVLSDISFTVKKGDYVGIIGPNGSGKTTLIKIILDLLKPTQGSVLMNQTIKDDLKISYVSQQVYSHYKNFPITVFEVVRMGLFGSKGFFKFYNKEDDALVMAMLERLNIKHLKDQQMVNLSGGERQRALLGRALINNPELIILDEPTSALDPEFREEFYKLMTDVNESGVTILLVSHDLGVLESYVNKILYLDSNLEYFGDKEGFRQSKAYGHRHGEVI